MPAAPGSVKQLQLPLELHPELHPELHLELQCAVI